MKLFDLFFDDLHFTVYSSKKYSNTPDGYMLFEGPYVIVGSDNTCIICESLISLQNNIAFDIISNLIDPLSF